MKTVAERAATLRLQGLTQAEIGERIGLSQGRVSIHLKSPEGRSAQTTRRAEAIENQYAPLPAKSCRCPSPVTYTEDDGERRCICGRQAREYREAA